MRALLTGTTGFIGAALARRLVADGHAVHALTRPGSDTARMPAGVIPHVLDGTTEQLCSVLASVQPDLVMHLASLFLADHTPAQVEPLIQSNLLFGTQLLEAMRQSGVRRLLNTGTVWQHWHSAAVQPVNLYAATKQAFEQILAWYHDAHGLAYTTLKLCDTYGAGDPRRKLVALLLEAAVQGDTLAMSPGEQVLDLTHIDDVVAAFLRAADLLLAWPESTPPANAAAGLASPQHAADAVPGGTCCVSGARHTLKEVVAIVAEVTGRPLHVTFGGRPYRAREVMRPATECAPPVPGWAPRHDLRSGLRSLLAASPDQ